MYRLQRLSFRHAQRLTVLMLHTRKWFENMKQFIYPPLWCIEESLAAIIYSFGINNLKPKYFTNSNCPLQLCMSWNKSVDSEYSPFVSRICLQTYTPENAPTPTNLNSSPPSATYIICVSELGQRWFRQLFVACLAPSHYLKQYWHIVNWTPRNKLQWKLNRNTKRFIDENACENVVCRIGGHFVSASMC